MTYNPSILPELLRVRSLSPSLLSERLGMDTETLERELQREPEPRQGILNDIARELALPPFVFFMRAPPPLNFALPDFRSETPAPMPKWRQTTEAIQSAEAVQKVAGDVRATSALDMPTFDAVRREDIDIFALSTREFFQISLEDQLEASDTRVFYNICRKKIEDKGIFILHDSFPESDGSGFCLAQSRYPVIVINTKRQNRGRRLFTLVHELAHVLMGQSGISDPFVRRNAIETRCNRFASSFLIPKMYVNALLRNFTPPRSPDLDQVALMARRLKVSQQAAILRLEELHLVQNGSHAHWLAAVHSVGNPDFSDRGGGAGGPPPQEKVKLAKYGFHFAATFDEALRQGRISEINLYRATGLKPKYQRDYFQFANAISSSELQTLELDDDV